MLIKFYEWLTGKCYHNWTYLNQDACNFYYECKKCGVVTSTYYRKKL